MTKILCALIFIFALTSCGGSSDTESPSVNQPDPAPTIPLTPFLTQLGDVTIAPGGDNTLDDHCFGVTVDSAGNSYCAGRTSGGFGEASGGGSNDAFVMKLDSSGALVWVTQLGAVTTAPGGDNSGYDECHGVFVDSAGNVYCAGASNGGLGEANGGGFDAFVMKLDSSGAVVWVTQLGAVTTAPGGGDNSGIDECNGVSVDSAGNVYCAGASNGGLGEANGGGFDAFVMKLDSSGAVVWVTQLGAVTTAPGGGSNTGADLCNGVSVDSAGNVYCAGQTNGGIGEANAGTNDAFAMKLDSSGAVVWVTQFGDVTTAPGGSNTGADECNGVSVDSTGNVYCAGFTNGGIGEANGGSYDAFIMKLDSSGALVWVTQLGAVTTAAGGSNTGFDQCQGVSVDSAGNVYCAGQSDGGIGEANGGGYDAFVMKLDSSGAVVWGTQLGSVTTVSGGDKSNFDQCQGVSVDSAGNVYCAGITYGGLGEANGGSGDVFVMKLKPDGALN